MEIRLQPEKEVLVIVGGWNANILLNGEWLQRYLFPGADLELTLPFGPNLPTPPAISAEDVRISLLGPKLSLISLKPKPDTSDYDRIEEIGTKIADYLPHTPVSAVGINFVFEADATGGIPICPKGTQQEVHDVLDGVGKVTEEVHKYSLAVDRGVLNLSIQQPTEGNHSYNFNFHHAVKSLAEFKELVAECSISEHKARAEAILSEFVGLAENEGEVSHGS